MKEIPLTQGYFTKVDDEDYDFLMQWKWHVSKRRKNNIYAIRNQTIDKNKQTHICLHRVITNCPNELVIDHIDHDGLNNQKSNLRICTPQQNSKNRTGYGSSHFLGVSYSKRSSLYGASIRINKKDIFLGMFKEEWDAAVAYNNAAIIYHGEFANLNKRE